MLRLVLNGRPWAEEDGRRIERVRSDRVWALLGYLTIDDDWVTRETLAAELWPDAEPIQARQRLRQTLLYVRAAFAPSMPIVISRHSVRLADGIEVDARMGVAPNFLDGWEDGWLERCRPKSGRLSVLAAAPDRNEMEAEIVAEVAGLGEVAQDAYVVGQLLRWQMRGILEPPIRALETVAREGRLGEAGHLALADMRLIRGELAEGEAWLEKKGGADRWEAWRTYLRGVLAHRKGTDAAAARHYRRAHKLAEKAEGAVALNALYMLGYTDPVHDDPVELAKVAARGLRGARAQRDELAEASFLLLYAFADHAARKFESVRRRLAEIDKALLRIDQPHRVAPVLGRVGRLYQDMGDFELGDACLVKTLALVRRTDNPRLTAEALTVLADRWLEDGRNAEAMALYLEAVAIRREGQTGWSLATSLRGAGLAAVRLENTHQARTLLTESIELYERQGDLPGAVSALFPMAQLFESQGLTTKARRCAEAARDILKSRPQPPTALDLPPIFATLDVVEAMVARYT